jgi:hypothetical protein
VKGLIHTNENAGLRSAATSGEVLYVMRCGHPSLRVQ